MNKGTKIRLGLTIAAIVAITILVIKSLCVASVILGAFVICVMIINHWFNNDYSEEHCIATGEARLKKKTRKGNLVGENFYDEAEEVEDNE